MIQVGHSNIGIPTQNIFDEYYDLFDLIRHKCQRANFIISSVLPTMVTHTLKKHHQSILPTISKLILEYFKV